MANQASLYGTRVGSPFLLHKQHYVVNMMQATKDCRSSSPSQSLNKRKWLVSLTTAGIIRGANNSTWHQGLQAKARRASASAQPPSLPSQLPLLALQLADFGVSSPSTSTFGGWLQAASDALHNQLGLTTKAARVATIIPCYSSSSSSFHFLHADCRTTMHGTRPSTRSQAPGPHLSTWAPKKPHRMLLQAGIQQEHLQNHTKSRRFL